MFMLLPLAITWHLQPYILYERINDMNKRLERLEELCFDVGHKI
jgi:hypothetical protein